MSRTQRLKVVLALIIAIVIAYHALAQARPPAGQADILLLLGGGFEDLRLWCPDEGGGIGAGGPDVGPQEAEEAFCLAGGVEVEVNDDIVGVADRSLDALPADPGLPPGLGEAPERGTPGIEVGNGVFDVEC